MVKHVYSGIQRIHIFGLRYAEIKKKEKRLSSALCILGTEEIMPICSSSHLYFNVLCSKPLDRF
jgi:hypothetical protein